MQPRLGYLIHTSAEDVCEMGGHDESRVGGESEGKVAETQVGL